MRKLIAIIITLALITSCTTDTAKKNKKKPKAKKTQVQKKANAGNKQANGKAKKADSTSYWPSLQKHLGINDAKLAQVKSVSSAYDKSKAKLKKDSKGKIVKSELDKWKTQKSNALKKLLGDNLYAKMVAFDSKKKKGKAPKKKAAAKK